LFPPPSVACPSFLFFLFHFFAAYVDHRDLHSFPTRRSSDLDARPTIWVPAEWGGEYDRSEVHAAVDEVFYRYKVKRMYCDPFWWETEIGDWAQEYGDEVVMEWRTNRPQAMFESISRFEIDLRNGRITHDGCPITAEHVGNAVKKNRKGQIYLLDKPEEHQKIDAAMTSILAHEAWADAVTD